MFDIGIFATLWRRSRLIYRAGIFGLLLAPLMMVTQGCTTKQNAAAAATEAGNPE